jgi:hypothetical protein
MHLHIIITAANGAHESWTSGTDGCFGYLLSREAREKVVFGSASGPVTIVDFQM